jgi:hypothetical protein
MEVTGTVSPTPAASDYVQFQILSGTDRVLFTCCTMTNPTLGIFQGQIGLDARNGVDDSWAIPYAGLAPGAAISIVYEWRQLGGTLVEADTVTGYTWDPVSGLVGVTAHLMNKLNQMAFDMADVLAAVTRTWT